MKHRATPKRIAIISMYFPPDKNGMAVYADKLYKFLVSNSYKVTVITRYLPQRQRNDWLRQIKIPSVKLDKRAINISKNDQRIYSLKFSQEAYKKIFSNIDKVNIVHCLSCWDDYLIVYPFTRRVNRSYRLILTIGGGGCRGPKEINFRRGKILNKVDVITFLSRQIKNELELLEVKKPRMIFTPPSVDLRLFSLYKRKLNRELIVLYLGRISKEKGVKDILEIAKYFNNSIKFYLVGEGDEKQNLKKQLKRRKISNVKILGGVEHEESLKYFYKAAVFLHPTYDDEFPVAVLEAMSTGLPVISTSVGEISKLVKSGENGFLCQPGDIPCFVKAIKRLTNLKKRESFGQISREIAERYSEKKMKNIFLEIYKSLIEK